MRQHNLPLKIREQIGGGICCSGKNTAYIIVGGHM